MCSNPANSLNGQCWAQELAWAGASKRKSSSHCFRSQDAPFLPGMLEAQWRVLFWQRPGKASTSLLFGQSAFVRQCLSAGKPDSKLVWRRLHSRVQRHNALFAEGPRLRVVVPLGLSKHPGQGFTPLWDHHLIYLPKHLCQNQLYYRLSNWDLAAGRPDQRQPRAQFSDPRPVGTHLARRRRKPAARFQQPMPAPRPLPRQLRHGFQKEPLVSSSRQQRSAAGTLVTQGRVEELSGRAVS